jgi:hypothetical protein
MPLFLGKLKEGLIYDIVDFNVTPAGGSYLPFHNPIKIDFTVLTKVTEVDNHDDTIPAHKFSFADYQSIINRTDTVKYLTGKYTTSHLLSISFYYPSTYLFPNQIRLNPST